MVVEFPTQEVRPDLFETLPETYKGARRNSLENKYLPNFRQRLRQILDRLPTMRQRSSAPGFGVNGSFVRSLEVSSLLDWCF